MAALLCHQGGMQLPLPRQQAVSTHARCTRRQLLGACIRLGLVGLTCVTQPAMPQAWSGRVRARSSCTPARGATALGQAQPLMAAMPWPSGSCRHPHTATALSLQAGESQPSLTGLRRSLQAAVPGTLPAPLEDTSAPAVFMARAAEAWQALAVRLGSLRWRLQRQVSLRFCPTCIPCHSPPKVWRGASCCLARRHLRPWLLSDEASCTQAVPLPPFKPGSCCTLSRLRRAALVVK